MGRTITDLSAEDMAPLEAAFEPTYPAALREIATVLYAGLLGRADLAPLGQAGLADLALMLTEQLSLGLGGHTFYMHKGASHRLSARNRAMLQMFRGTNYDEIAQRFGLSDMRARQIIDNLQRADFLSRQSAIDFEP